MHMKLGLLSPEKARSHTAIPSFCSSCVQCFRVFIPPAVRPTLLRQMDMGSLTCAHIRVRAVHTKRGQAQTSLLKSWLGGTEKLLLTPIRQGIEPKAFGFQLSNHWATSTIRRTPALSIVQWTTNTSSLPTELRPPYDAPPPYPLSNEQQTSNTWLSQLVVFRQTYPRFPWGQ